MDPGHRLEPEAEALLIDPVKTAGVRRRNEGVSSIKLGIGIGLVTAALVAVAWASMSRADRAIENSARNTERVDALYTVGKQWEAAAKKAGETGAAPSVDDVAEDPGVVDDPVQAPPPREVSLPGKPGPTGARGPAPSPAEVAQAVASYCAAHGGCSGPAGASVTPVQVAAAVSTYCGANGQCKGPQGAPGNDSQVPGPKGEDSTVPGPQGEKGDPPSPTEVYAAVEAFCADNVQCVGPQGAPGKDSTVPGPEGQKGDTGPAPESWTFEFLGQTYQCTDKDEDLAYECTPI